MSGRRRLARLRTVKPFDSERDSGFDNKEDEPRLSASNVRAIDDAMCVAGSVEHACNAIGKRHVASTQITFRPTVKY